MDNIVAHLTALSNQLDKMGKLRCADNVDSLISNGSVVKVAQYVGVIGYVLKQNRAMGNCVRKKRVASNASMQEVVLECLKEYQDGQEYGNNEWTSKYAQVVEQCPDRFNDAHLEFLRDVAANNNMDRHIFDIASTAEMLDKNNIQDSLLNEVLANVETLGDILQKEGNSSVNFKLAAPVRERGFWDKFTNPSQRTKWNPFSWFSDRRERGRAKDDTLETKRNLDVIIKDISDISNSTQSMKTSIVRLKNQASVYLSNPNADPEQRNQVSSLIQRLNLKDWNINSSIVQQLSQVADPAFQDIFRHVNVNEFVDNIHKVYESIREIQTTINLLRQSKAIRGENDPAYSPAEEFGALDRVLSKLYQNPFDEKAQYYASMQHARLENKLMRGDPKEDVGMQEWLSQDNQSFEEANIPEAESDQNKEVNTDLVNSIVSHLLSDKVIKADDPKELAKQLSTILGGISANNPHLKAVVDALRDYVNSAPMKNNNATSANPVSTTNPISSLDPSWSAEGNGPSAIASINYEVLTKIADVIDPLDKDLANLIDNYIEENLSNEFPDFPSVSELIKENKGNSNIAEQV